MRQIVLLIFIALLSGCSGNDDKVANSTIGDKPKLHLIDVEGQRFLADDDGVLKYSLQPPHVTMDVDRKVIMISPTVHYAPGTTYYKSKYDGFTVSCGGHPRSGVEGQVFSFGPEAGEFQVPKTPYNHCLIQAFVVDSEGTKFTTDNYPAFFFRGE